MRPVASHSVWRGLLALVEHTFDPWGGFGDSMRAEGRIQGERREATVAHRKTTSQRVASRASRILRSPSASKRMKSVAGSALSQKHAGRKKQ